MDAVADLAYGAGFRGDGLAIAVAVAKAESNLDPRAYGDLSLQDAKWGPSVGLWQIRTLKAERGKGGDRDELALIADVGRQARAAYAISGGGSNFRPWSMFTNGGYRRHLTDARAAADARTARGGSGSTAAAPFTGPHGPSSPDVLVPVSSLPTAYVAPSLPAGLNLSTPQGPLNLADLTLGGQVDLTLEETSEVQLRLINTGFGLAGRGQGIGSIGATLKWGDLDMRVAANELAPTRSGSELVLTLRDRAVQELKRTNTDVSGEPYPTKNVPGGSHKNISPTEYADIQARRVGLRLLGEGSARRSDITAEKDGNGLYESPWAVIARLARELGFVAFSSGGVIHFGRPAWLISRVTGFKVSAFRPELGGAFVGAWGDRDADSLEVPRIRESEDAPFFGRSLSFRLPRWRGEMVRPGMRVELAGILGVPVNWLVTQVAWPIDYGIGAVEVEAVEPTDPRATKPSVSDGAAGGAKQQSSGDGGWQWPTSGRVSSEFGQRDGRLHAGIDIAAPTGRPIRPSRAGKVTRAARSESYGNVVYVDHGDGYETRYAHQHRLLVKVGDSVQPTTQLGEVGSTGRSTGPHLHYEILKNGTPLNPRNLHQGDP